MTTQTKTLALIIARLTSSRLPRKQLRLINGVPLIQHIVERIEKIPSLDQICLATGPREENQDLADFLTPMNVSTYFDDDVDDVTGRIARAARYFDADYVITISGDCPLVDAAFLSEGINILTTSDVDYVTVDKDQYQCLHEGLGFHTRSAWQRLDELSTTWSHKEHAGSVIYEKPELFTRGEIVPKPVFRRQDMRISVDTQADLDFINKLYDRSGISGTGLDLAAVVSMVDADRSILDLNKHVHQKTRFEKSRHLAIITYASQQLGMGHLSRCLALARELKESNSVNVIFLINDDTPARERVTKAEFPFYIYPDLTELETLITTQPEVQTCASLIIDIKSEDFEEKCNFIKEYEKPVTIIDVWPEAISENVLSIVPSLNCPPIQHDRKLYCGAEYILLDRAIRNVRQPESAEAYILLTAGAGGRITKQLIQIIGSLDQEHKIKVLVGPYADYESIESRFQEFPGLNYQLIQNPTDLYHLYVNSLLAFSVYGVTTLELMALGVPQIVYKTLNSSDAAIVKELTAQKLCFSMADLIETTEFSLDDLLTDTETLGRMGERSKAFIDGKGASRAAQLIVNHVDSLSEDINV